MPAEEGIAIEDSPNGVAAAKAAGLVCVAVPNPITRELDLRAADLVLESLADLPLRELLAWASARSTSRSRAGRTADEPDEGNRF